MASSVLILTIFTTFITYVSSDRFPAGFSPCPKSDVGAETCLRSSAQTFVAFLSEGNPEYNVTRMHPLSLTDFLFDQNGVSGSLKDAELSGLKDATVSVFTLNWTAKTGHLAFNVPFLQFIGTYLVDGLIATLRIIGQTGICDVKMYNVDIIVDFNIEEHTGTDGKLYMKFTNPKSAFEVHDNVVFAENTHGPFDLLAKTVLQVLTLGWNLFVKNTFGPFFNVVVDLLLRNLNVYFSQVSENELFIF